MFRCSAEAGDLKDWQFSQLAWSFAVVLHMKPSRQEGSMRECVRSLLVIMSGASPSLGPALG